MARKKPDKSARAYEALAELYSRTTVPDESNKMPKRGRGRPKSVRATKEDGSEEIVKGGDVLIRALLVLGLYERAREAGDPIRKARRKAVSEFKTQYPGARISETEVARIVAQFQPADGEEAFIATGDAKTVNVRIGQRPSRPSKKGKPISFGNRK